MSPFLFHLPFSAAAAHARAAVVDEHAHDDERQAEKEDEDGPEERRVAGIQVKLERGEP